MTARDAATGERAMGGQLAQALGTADAQTVTDAVGAIIEHARQTVGGALTPARQELLAATWIPCAISASLSGQARPEDGESITRCVLQDARALVSPDLPMTSAV